MMETRKIAFLTPMEAAVRAEVQRLLPAGFSLAFAATSDRAEHEKMLADAEFAIAAGTWIAGDLIRHAPRLRLIQKWGIGVDKIDLAAAREAGVAVAITAGEGAAAVSEHAIMLMLAVYRRLPLAHASLTRGEWIAPSLRAQCRRLAGKTVGLLGFGNIARLVAKRLSGFDVEVVYHARGRAPEDTERALGVAYVDRDTLLARSDVLSLHLPLNPQTRHLIDAAAFGKMRPQAVLINTARGEIVDEAALIAALESGRIGGAGLDTFADEPPRADHPFWQMNQVVATPHSAGSVFDSIALIVGHAMDNIQRFADGRPLPEADIIVAPPEKETRA
jgi:D-3-phosphoglycerate dehydrogenase